MKTYYAIGLSVCMSLSLNAQIAPYATQYFDGNNYKALLSAKGNHFWDYNERRMFVPSAGNTASGPGSVYASSIWIGGLDSSGQLHFAGELHNQIGKDFDPGPVSEVYDDSIVSIYNQVWKVEKAEIEAWLANPYTQAPPQSVLDWPANGRSAPYNEGQILAPFVDHNDDGIYDPVNDFDYPLIRGDQALFFMYNDDQHLNTESGGQQMGVEVRGMAYGFNCNNEALENTLFFHYEVTNRSDNDYTDVHIGLWNDFDLGNPQDDFVGSDPMRSLFFAYNGDNNDESTNDFDGYGTMMPAQGIRLLKGVKLPNDVIDNQPGIGPGEYPNGYGWGDGSVDNECIGLSGVSYQNNAPGGTGDPVFPEDYHNLLKGIWRDGFQMTYGGDGHDETNPNATPARFMFPDSSDIMNFGTNGISMPEWSETSAGNVPGDRRGIGAMGPFKLSAGETVSFDIAYVFAQDSTGADAAIMKMKTYSDSVAAMFNSCCTPCGKIEHDDLVLGMSQEIVKPRFNLYPNPTNGEVTLVSISNTNFDVQVYDLNGRLVTQHLNGNGTIKLDLNTLERGMYLVRYTDATDSQTKQLLVH